MPAEFEENSDFESAFTSAAAEPLEETPVEAPAEVTEEAPAEVLEEAPVETPVESPEPVAEPAQPSEQLTALLGTAANLGISTEGMTSEAELAAAVMDKIQAQQPYVQFAQQRLPEESKYQAYLASQQAPAPQAEAEPEWTPEGHFTEQYGGPVWQDKFQDAVNSGFAQQDELGNWTAAPGYELTVGPMLPEMNAAQAHSRQFWKGMTQGNPFKTIYGAVKEPIMREIRSEMEQFAQQREHTTQTQNEIQQFEAANSAVLYTRDAVSGQTVPSEQGTAFFSKIDELRDAGIEDPAQLLKFARDLTGIGAAPAAAPPAAAPAAAPPAEAPKQKETFLEAARKRAGHSPSTAAGSQPGEDVPQTVTENDLSSMFTRALKAASN